MRISFNRPPFVGKETEYIKEAVEKNGMICGDVSITPDTVLSGEMTILALGEYKALQKC